MHGCGGRRDTGEPNPVFAFSFVGDGLRGAVDPTGSCALGVRTCPRRPDRLDSALLADGWIGMTVSTGMLPVVSHDIVTRYYINAGSCFSRSSFAR